MYSNPLPNCSLRNIAIVSFRLAGTLQVGYRQPSDEPEGEGGDAEFEAAVPTWQHTVRGVPRTGHTR